MGKLHAAARDGQSGAAIKMIEARCDVNEVDNMNCTPLHYAARRGLTEVVVKLLEANGDPTPANDKGQTALYQAVVGGHAQITRSLVAAGAEINMKSSTGIMPVHFAARSGNLDIVQILVGAGADVTLTNNQGLTPKKIAIQYGHTEIVELLDRLSGAPPQRTSSNTAEKVRHISRAFIEGEIDEEAALMMELEAIEIKLPIEGTVPAVVQKQVQTASTARTSSERPGPRAGRTKAEIPAENRNRAPSPDLARGRTTRTVAQEQRAAAVKRHKSPARHRVADDPATVPVAATPQLPPFKHGASRVVNAPVTAARTGRTETATELGGELASTSPTSWNSDLTGRQGSSVVLNVAAASLNSLPRQSTNDPESGTWSVGKPKSFVAGQLQREPSVEKVKQEPEQYKGPSMKGPSMKSPIMNSKSSKKTNRTTNLDKDMEYFLTSLGLLERCEALVEDAGIVVPADFLLFTQEELIKVHMFKTGHVRKIFAELEKSGTTKKS